MVKSRTLFVEYAENGGGGGGGAHNDAQKKCGIFQGPVV